MGRMSQRRAAAAAITAVVSVAALTTGLAGARTTYVNWPSYMFGPPHSSRNAAATAVTPENAGSLVQAWNWVPDAPLPGQPQSTLFSTPVTYNGRIFIGANTGNFYALDEATGNVVWQRFLGFAPEKTCSTRGFTSTAAVAKDPSTGAKVVYINAPDGYLYALRADTGDIVWQSVVEIPSDQANDYYPWGSPVVLKGHVYVPLSSQCDHPLIRGGVKEYDQVSGAELNAYYTVGQSDVGGSIWTTPAASIDGSLVWVTTGNGPKEDDSFSIVRLDGQTLARLDGWQLPEDEIIGDGDFGGSPTLFQAMVNGTRTKLIGACNKNGKYYVLRRNNLSQGVVWSFQAGASTAFGQGACLAGAIWDGSRLFVASNATTIDSVEYHGAIRRLDPATGTPIWETGLTGAVLGSPTDDGSGVLAAASWDYSSGAANRVWLLDAATGAILNAIDLSSGIFAQPVWADHYLLVATQKKGLYAFTP